MFLHSPSDLSQGPQWTPPAIQGISIDDYETATRRDKVIGQLPSTPMIEVASANADRRVSTSSCSESSESDSNLRSHLSSYRNFPSRRYFKSKPIHPLSFSTETPREVLDSPAGRFPGFYTATPRRDAHCWSSASSSTDFADVTEQVECEKLSWPSDGFKCGLCDKFLSQRSPWSSRGIVKNGDMPIASVLSCRHVFHAECLERTTPKTHKPDPPCPLCIRPEDEDSPERRVITHLSDFSKLGTSSEAGPSKPWVCLQAGDCVQGALHTPPRNATLLLNRNRLKKNLSLNGSSSKDFPGKLRKTSPRAVQFLSGKSVDRAAIRCSKDKTGPSFKRSC